jgi:hypothetical protein
LTSSCHPAIPGADFRYPGPAMMGVLSADVHHEKHALNREVRSVRPLILRSACGASVGQWAPGAAVTVRGSGCQGLSGTMVRD